MTLPSSSQAYLQMYLWVHQSPESRWKSPISSSLSFFVFFSHTKFSQG